MGQLASDIGRKAIALAVLLVVGYILFRLLIGFIAGLVWIAVLVLAVIAGIWAFGVLRSSD